MSKKKLKNNYHDFFGTNVIEKGISDPLVYNSLKNGIYTNIKWSKAGYFNEESFIKYNLPEHPPNVDISKLSDILDKEVDEDFFLSRKACAGILLRSVKRSKKMSPELEKIIRTYMESMKVENEK